LKSSRTWTSRTTSASGYKDQEFGLDPNGHSQGMTGPVSYYHVDDLEGTLGRLLEGGATDQ
jgi:hypothetical protein